MYSKVMTITPAEATLWLDTKNSRNRPVSLSTVQRYAQEIKAGRWTMNGQPIIFGKDGQLLNGQHRLKAVVAANKQIETLVVYGIENETFDTIDDGNKRSLADVFFVKGEGNPKLLSSGVRFLWVYATGQMKTRDLRRGKIATKAVLENTLDKHPGLRSSVKFYSMLKKRPGGLLIPAGMAIGLHYLFALIDEAKADEFFTKFQSGYELTEGNPVSILRSSLITGKKDADKEFKSVAMYTYVVKAWNAFVLGQQLTRLVYSTATPVVEIENIPKKMLKDLL